VAVLELREELRDVPDRRGVVVEEENPFVSQRSVLS
jgi:hypothetical protein